MALTFSPPPLPQKTTHFEEPKQICAEELCSDLSRKLSLPTPIFHYLRPSRPEFSAVQNASQARSNRRQEFSLGRHCAEQALSKIGIVGKIANVGVAKDRSPIWPLGVVGSISHSTNFTWSAVSKRTNFRSLGIDTEPVVEETVFKQIKDEIVSDHEWAEARVKDKTHNDCELLSIIFSAKEAFYKCWHPLTKHFFEFRDAIAAIQSDSQILVSMSPDSQRFTSSIEATAVRFCTLHNNIFSITWTESSN